MLDVSPEASLALLVHIHAAAERAGRNTHDIGCGYNQMSAGSGQQWASPELRVAAAGDGNSMGDERFTIVAISGALRKRSFNSGLLRAAQQVTPDGVTIEIHDLIDIPLYNGDVEAAGIPE